MVLLVLYAASGNPGSTHRRMPTYDIPMNMGFQFEVTGCPIVNSIDKYNGTYTFCMGSNIFDGAPKCPTGEHDDWSCRGFKNHGINYFHKDSSPGILIKCNTGICPESKWKICSEDGHTVYTAWHKAYKGSLWDFPMSSEWTTK